MVVPAGAGDSVGSGDRVGESLGSPLGASLGPVDGSADGVGASEGDSGARSDGGGSDAPGETAGLAGVPRGPAVGAHAATSIAASSVTTIETGKRQEGRLTDRSSVRVAKPRQHRP